MRIMILLLVLAGLALPASAQNQATQLAEASARITQALNLYAQAADSIRSQMTAQQKMGTALFFAAAMALEDNSLSLSGLCQLQQLSKSPTATKQRIVTPLVQQYRTSNSQQVKLIPRTALTAPESGAAGELRNDRCHKRGSIY